MENRSKETETRIRHRIRMAARGSHLDRPEKTEPRAAGRVSENRRCENVTGGKKRAAGWRRRRGEQAKSQRGGNKSRPTLKRAKER